MDLIIKIYSFFYQRITGHITNYEIKDREKKLIDNFEKKLNKEVGKGSWGFDYLFNYFAFQFEYWRDKETQIKSFYLSWFLGNKAFDRWKNKNKNYLYFCEEGILKEYKIDKNLLSSFLFIKKRDFVLINSYIEIEKKRFHNKEKGFAHCLISTDLYNHRSVLCLTCKSKIECQNILKNLYPFIYEKRGYNR